MSKDIAAPRVAILIPARFKSSRFPGKPLVKLCGKPMILWVAEIAAKPYGRDAVYVATDNQEIFDVARAAGFNAVMTSSDALTGTDRIAEAAEKIDADIFINVQGDEPLIDPLDISKVAEEKKKYMGDVVNGYSRITSLEDPASVNIPKVVVASDGYLIYMSRALVPGSKNPKPSDIYHKQVCIYAFTREELRKFSSVTKKERMEESEDIEILRFLEMGRRVRMVELGQGSLAVDVPSDVERVEAAMRERGIG